MLNAAVIGVGNMGQHHARVYYELPEVNLVAIADRDVKNARILANKYQCNLYENYKKMLNQERIDLVSIAVPTPLHKKIAIDVLNSGKHLLLEKPIASTISEAEQIIKIAKRKKLKFTVGHIERYNPAVKKLKEVINQDKLGKIISIVIKRVGTYPQRFKDANVIVDLAVHDLDIINCLFGNKVPNNISVLGGEALNNKKIDYAEIMFSHGEIDCVIQVNWITPVKIRELAITGTEGYAEVDYINQKLVFYRGNVFINYGNFKEFVEKISRLEKKYIKVDKMEPLKLEISSFIKSVKENRPVEVSGEDALFALKTVNLINKKLITSKK